MKVGRKYTFSITIILLLIIPAVYLIAGYFLHESFHHRMMDMLLFMGLGGFISIANLIMVKFFLIDPLQKIGLFLSGYAENGNLTQRIDMKKSDEFGVLGKEINLLLKRVEDFYNEKKSSELIYSESDLKLKAFLDRSPDGILITDTEGRIIEWNQGQEDITGLMRTDVIGNYVWDVEFQMTPPQQRNAVEYEKLKRHMQNILISGKSPLLNSINEFEFYPADAKVRNVQLQTFVIKSDQKYMICSICRDITKQKEMEKEVIRSRNFYLQLFNSFPSIIWRLNKEGKCDYVNNAWKNFTGKKDEDAYGDGWLEEVHPDDVPVCLINIQSSLDRQSTVSYDYRLRYKDGDYHWFSVFGSPYRELDGNFGGYIRTAYDIQDKMKAELNLKDNEKKYRTLVENASNLIIQLDYDGKILFANTFTLSFLNLCDIEVIGKSLYEVLPVVEAKEEASARILEDLMNYPLIKDLDGLKHRLKDGREVWILWVSKALHDSTGNVLGWLNIGNDITDLKLAEIQLKGSLREKEVLLKEIHHRVKNNLQIVISLLRRQSEFLKDKADINIFQDSMNRVKSMALIHETLYKSKDYSKIDFGKYVAELVAFLFTTYGVNFEKIRFLIEIENVILSISTAIPCGLIINELITNSLKYAFPENRTGTIYISFSMDENKRCTLNVRDDGIGLREDLDWNNLKSIGISLVKDLCRQIGGKLDYKSGPGFDVTIQFQYEE